MRKAIQKVLSVVLVTGMLFSALPLPALAAEQGNGLRLSTSFGGTDAAFADAGEFKLGEPVEKELDGGTFADFGAGIPAALAETEEANIVTLQGRTQEEVKAALQTYPIDTNRRLTFTETPDMNTYKTAGKLSAADYENGLNAVNLYRYIAGLEPVGLTDEYNESAQYGSVCDAAINELNHRPSRAEGMPEGFYQKGYAATSSSNLFLSYGSANLAEAVICFMADYGNSTTIGHRRWILNPVMGNTGFGAAYASNGYTYIAMKAFDQSNSTAQTPYVVWPCENTPYNLAAGLMTISMDIPSNSMNDITVTAQSAKTGKTYTYNDGTDSDGYFLHQTSNYGVANCIIFGDINKQRVPQFSIDDTIAVTVSYTDNSGAPCEIHYTISYLDENGNTPSSQTPSSPSISSGDDMTAILVIGGVIIVGAGILYVADRVLPIKTVSGQIVDQYGTGMPGVTVELRKDGNIVRTATTDENGTFSMRVARGTYQLVLRTQSGEPIKMTDISAPSRMPVRIMIEDKPLS